LPDTLPESSSVVSPADVFGPGVAVTSCVVKPQHANAGAGPDVTMLVNDVDLTAVAGGTGAVGAAGGCPPPPPPPWPSPGPGAAAAAT